MPKIPAFTKVSYWRSGSFRPKGTLSAVPFLAQRGIYTSDKSGDVVEEDGGQVIIIDLFNTARDVFDVQMVELAEEICQRMEQEMVVVEIQKNGIVQRTMGVTP